MPESTQRNRRKPAVLRMLAIIGALLVTATAYGQDFRQSREERDAKDRGCVSCHAGIEKMHATPGVFLACVDCHGGDASLSLPAGASATSEEGQRIKAQSHVQPSYPKLWTSRDRSPSANPERTYTLSLKESAEFIRFVNPGDLRVAEQACGACHEKEVNAVRKHPMTTTSIFWAAAAYANGILPSKSALFGESYSRNGIPQVVKSSPTPEQKEKGALEQLLPLPHWEVIQPGEYFRAFERGGIFQLSSPPEIGNPPLLDDPGRPDIRLSNRGRGTGLRISPALVNLQKTRLNDPHLSFFGTNDQPGDFRSSGCTGCHVVYANDRDPVHSGPWAQFGNMGASASKDPMLQATNGEPGHPIVHRFTRAIPTSQCMSCHMHQPNSFVNTYLGYIMWDYESDGNFLWPKEQRYPTEKEKRDVLERNPEGAAPRGLWSDVGFLAEVSKLNPQLEDTQFADYHGHGWLFRGVFNRDRKGNLLDASKNKVAFDDPEKFKKAVHLRDIHAERGMHCVDCHFSLDAHGDGLIHGEYSDAIEIRCEDCHGSVDAETTLRTSGPMAPAGGTDLSRGTTPFGQRRFQWTTKDGSRRLIQRSMLEEDLEWPVLQVKDTVTSGHPDYSEDSARAKTVRTDGKSWGSTGGGELAHGGNKVACFTCHSSWMTSCSGCHLPQEANVKSKMAHYEGRETRNFATYNPQVIRTDMFIMGVDSDNRWNRIAPVRSSSALILSSTNQNRQRFYMQQPPISAPGYSSQAFNPHVPHTVRTTETKQCTDCHVSAENDNNAWMAGVLGHGTNFPNFIGRFAWVGLGKNKGIEGVAVTEWEEPQPVIGSYLHSLVFPDFYAKHQKRGLELEVSHHHHGHGEVRSIQLRGEFLFTTKGHGGLKVYDVANIDNKDFSERIVSAPVSPMGQRTFIKTKNATAVALPTTMPVAPWRRVSEMYPANDEQEMHPIYRYAFVSDSEEGLILVNVDTLTDGIPTNNFFERTLIYGKKAYNPEGRLAGARALTVAGNYVWVAGDSGLVALDFGEFAEGPQAGKAWKEGKKPDPIPQPKVAGMLDELNAVTSIAVQFRYLFVTDDQGLAVVDITDPTRPRLAGRVPIADARNVYVARTYAYVAAGAEGLVIVDIERPEAPFVDQKFNGGGKLKDSWDVKVASTSSSLFAYVADGKQGLHVIQLTSPKAVPGYLGFSPRPEPKLVATKHTHGPALALSKGLDRDRAVDESGNQVSIFNRIGARPFNAEEMKKLYMKDGKLFQVEDTGGKGE